MLKVNDKIVLNKVGDEVFFEDKKVAINPQSSKGPGKEVICLNKLVEENVQQYISLSKCVDGLNEFTLKERKVVDSKKFELTKEEKEEVDRLQSRIDEIVKIAKSRFVPSKKAVTIEKMTKEQLEKYIEDCNNMLKLKLSK